MSWWTPDKYQKKRSILEKRARIIRAMRDWFDERGFLAVETPALQVSPGMEPHLHAFRTEILNPERDKSRPLYLHTSPEFAMKKLLVAGLPRIYQICAVYRNAEGSSQHSCEFTMIEWYRAQASYTDIMQDCVDMVRAVTTEAGAALCRNRGQISDPFAEWERISVCEAFQTYAGIRLEDFLDDRERFAAALRARGYHTHPEDRWDDLFFRAFAEDIEPKLGQGRPTILYDYPVSMAALSRPKAGDPRFAERFELYICGMELANAFGELTDARAQKQRFEEDMALKQQLYGESFPIDPDFIAALEFGMPEAGGIALGVDRLVMLLTGADRIDDVLWTAKP